MSAPPPASNGTNDARDPSGFLSEIIGAPVTVKLNSGVVYKGTYSGSRLDLHNRMRKIEHGFVMVHWMLTHRGQASCSRWTDT